MAATTSKRKKAVAATVAAAALLLGGTFAWTSISQQALNENAGIVNVGGRLHDDFNGTNKDVYVENFTSPLDGGQPIYARVRLDEYMEVGQEAGGSDLDNDGTVDATPVLEGTERDKVSTWKTHVPQTVCEQCNLTGTCEIHDHWTWTMGGQTTYMPTFNKDKDSLAADINGTYVGTNRNDKVYYDDYVVYTTEGGNSVKVNDDSFVQPEGADKATPLTEDEGPVTKVTDWAYYDNDTNQNEETDGHVYPPYEENVRAEEETHTAKQTAEATVITMDEWLANPVAGNYWVYDEDGWAYWANPIMPGQATGLLLDQIEMTTNPGEKCYYGINVVGQFATVGDWEFFENQDGSRGLGEESNALKVVETAAAAVPTITVTNVNGVTTVEPGDKVQFSASVTVGGTSGQSEDQFMWSVVNKDGSVSKTSSIDDTGLLVVGDKEASEELYVLAEWNEMAGAVGVAGVMVNIPVPPEIAAIGDATAGSAETITIDNKEWYVVSKENGKALIMAKEPVNMAFSSVAEQNTWYNSDVRTYFNGEYLEGLPLLSEYVETTSLKTYNNLSINNWEQPTQYDDTEDKVFVLGFGDFNNIYWADLEIFQPERTSTKRVSEDIFNDIITNHGSLSVRTGYIDLGDEEDRRFPHIFYLNVESPDRIYPYSQWVDSAANYFPAMWVRYGEGISITNDTPDVYAEQGNVISFSAVKTTVTGETVQDPDVTWSISGNNTDEGGTTIDANGNVTIGNEEHGTVITVTAAATEDGSISDTFELTVTVPSLEVSTDNDRYYFDAGESVWLNTSIPENCSIANAELVYSIEDGNGDSINETSAWFKIAETEETGTVLTLTASTKDGKYSDSVEIEVGVPNVQIIEMGYLTEDRMNQWSELYPAEFQVRIVRDDELIELPYTYELNNYAYGTYIDEDPAREYPIRVITPEHVSEDGEWYTFSVTLDKDPNVGDSFTWGLQEINYKDDI